MPTLIIHIQNEDPVIGDVDALPNAADNVLIVKNPRKRDGKDLPYLDNSVNVVVWPFWRINFIEVLPMAEEEEIITFVRE
ncbi:hypothetical protein [Levilinea saccharolytica]|jgi:hypothetical protein|uniref:Uncharacterized protein n=1 Tax=Levilinea saccharolytica TaxID=229921 RepID=A0A0N8GPT0_9CHLR|nr:hypothetical protein [Levilinea saccharolytica]KPL81754.1 hypothetical protein ADN01_09145 [Levilinea saccharolytica]GAP17961.1 hypothetical protein LSAC_01842 [Levilinea saccharolytica]